MRRVCDEYRFFQSHQALSRSEIGDRTDEELSRLQQLLPPHEWRAVAFALGTGMRLSEQMGLKWANVDWDSRTATIPLSKSGKTRRVPLSNDVLGILREQFS